MLLLAGLWLLPIETGAVCPKGNILNPVKDVCWQCILPIKIAGVTTVPGPYENNYPDLASTPISLCPKPPLGQPTPCVPISFWEPARINETVKDPFCFPGVGLSLPLSGGLLGGGGSEQSSNSSSSNNTDTSSFAQAHHWVFLPWALLELLTDFICLEHSGFDVGYLTEVDPL